ncbi:MAG TPA: response regulator transcription factor [Acidimicrobiia bacterium]|nr:response regulator transcription factor [Acidimicrobiia bacterium]
MAVIELDHAAEVDGRRREVLVVDDEPTVREIVVAYLEREGYRTAEAADGEAALAAIASRRPDLVVLDVMLPKVDGFDILSRLRRDGDIPVVLLTARAEESDRVLGLGLGADDYVVKPFSPRELVARVRSVLRRASPSRSTSRLEFDGLVIDGSTREVHVRKRLVALTPKEFDLLAFLAAAPRQVFSRAQLLDHVWASSVDFQDPSTVTVHVRRLRQKIEDDPDDPRRVTTVWGVGYRFEP